MSTQQNVKQYKNVAVALVVDENGNILLTRPQDSSASTDEEWEFPTNEIIPGASYTETFGSHILEKTGCIIEAISLVSSEKKPSQSMHFEYVECKVICRDSSVKPRTIATVHKWVHPTKVKTYHKKRIHRDIIEFFGL